MYEGHHVYVITHTDLDGVASAGIALRLLNRGLDEATIIYAEPYNLDERLGEIKDYVAKGDLVIIADLGINRDIMEGLVDAIRSIRDSGARVEWFDHHVWRGEERARIESLGVGLWIDTSTCAAGVVAKYLPKSLGLGGGEDEFIARLVSATCSADLWMWSDPLSPKLFRVASDVEEPNKWRDRMVRMFLEGILWSSELDKKLEDYVNSELANFNKVLSSVYVLRGEISVAVAVKPSGPPSNSIIGASLLSRFDVDVAGILRPNGGLSLRSRRIDVQEIAYRLGGGGHPRAAGARIGIPRILRLVGSLYPKILSWYACRVILRAYSGQKY